MRLVEQHTIKKKHKFFKECDELAFKSKQLYNEALYVVRQEFINNNNYIDKYKMQKMLQGTSENYKSLPAKVSQQVLILLDQNWKSFFKAIKDWKKNPSKYLGKPNIPQYLHKEKGRQVVVYDRQAISTRELKKGIVSLSKTNIKIDFQNKDKELKQARIIKKNELYCIEIVYEVKEKELKKNGQFVSIDLGLDNLCTVVSETFDSFIVDGRPLKAMNNFYNKIKSKLMSYTGDKGTSKKIVKLTNKRNNKVKDYLHKTSRLIIDYCLANDVSSIVIGYNKGWKQNINIGKKNNQKFVSIPHSQLVDQINYKAQLEGISVILQEESYTSKCSFLDNEPIKKHEEYAGRRVKRGLFKSNQGIVINADVNGALNIARKCNPQFTIERIKGFSVIPCRVNPIKS